MKEFCGRVRLLHTTLLGEESYFLSSSRDKEFTFLGHRSKGRRRLTHISAYIEVASHLSIEDQPVQPITKIDTLAKL